MPICHTSIAMSSHIQISSPHELGRPQNAGLAGHVEKGVAISEKQIRAWKRQKLFPPGNWCWWWLILQWSPSLDGEGHVEAEKEGEVPFAKVCVPFPDVPGWLVGWLTDWLIG